MNEFYFSKSYPLTLTYIPFLCLPTVNPGDLIYFPDRYWHATINLSPYTAFVSTFTQEHRLIHLDDEL